MAGYGYDTSTLTIDVTLPDGEVVRVTGDNDGVNGYEWSAVTVGSGLRLPVTVGEQVLIDGINDPEDDEDDPDPVDRCEACGSDRGDGYCQECPDDPDRIYDARSD